MFHERQKAVILAAVIHVGQDAFRVESVINYSCLFALSSAIFPAAWRRPGFFPDNLREWLIFGAWQAGR
jgi:hypothetical protein